MEKISPKKRIVAALLFSSLISILFYLARALHYHSLDYWFLNWNLFLAWIPLGLAWLLYKRLKSEIWTTWQNLVLSFLWLGFLPNSFYIASDLVHLPVFSRGTILYDVVLILSFSLNGFFLGFLSLFLIHKQLVRRIKQKSHLVIASVLLICSFAIYLGRYLRWNTWDVIINPAGLLFDVSDRILNPSAHPQTFVTTFSFFALLGTIYFVIWQTALAIEQKSK